VQPVPLVGMLRVDAPELAEEEPELELRAALVEREGQARGGDERLLELEARLALGIELVEQVHLAREERVDGALQRQLRLLQREAALTRVVAAALQDLEALAAGLRPAGRHHAVEREVEELEPSAAQRERGAIARRAGGRRRPGCG